MNFTFPPKFFIRSAAGIKFLSQTGGGLEQEKSILNMLLLLPVKKKDHFSGLNVSSAEKQALDDGSPQTSIEIYHGAL